MSKELTPPSPSSSHGSSLSFTQGFLLGQLTISILIFIFIKFFIFGEPPPADLRASHRASLRHQRTLSHARRQAASSTSSPTTTSTTTPPSLLRKRSSRVLLGRPQTASPLPTATILAKTYYNVAAHQPESLDWFNVLVAQTIAQLRADAVQDDAVLAQLTEVLNRPGTKPEWVGEIKVTEISLGEEFPILSNCRVVAVSDEDGVGGGGGGGLDGGGGARVDGAKDGRLQARMDVDLSDTITLGVETKLVLNYPRPVSAVLPVALSVSLVRFSGTVCVLDFALFRLVPPKKPDTNFNRLQLSLSFTPAPPSPSQSSFPHNTSSHPLNSPRTPASSGPTGQLLTFTFLDDYHLDLSVRSLLGSRSRLQDVPKIAQLVEARLHAWFDERCVEPRFQQIQLPSLWPRKRNTRGGEGEEEDELEKEGGAEEEGKNEVRVKGNERKMARARSAGLLDEGKLAAEGEKIWEAEQRAQRAERMAEGEKDGMRWRGASSRDVSTNRGRSSEDTLRMPGGMPGMVMS
ncbi:MAG: hypothetical protein Q9157_006495 [Trypethelium eluteriae]